MMYRKFFAWVAVLGIVTGAGFAQQRHISIDDLRLEPEFTEAGDKIIGFHLFVRKKDGIESVLLTETTKDPAGIEANYAYRAPEWNPVNGNEIRMLNGERLVSPSARYSIIDSTPEADAQFGSAFHLYIPSTMVYGYPWTRNGTVKITRGTFINIRAFGAQYGDYSGGFDDNPFMFDLGKPVLPEKMPATEPAPVPEVLPEPETVVLTDKYNPMAAASFDSLAAVTGGQMRYAGSAETVSADILRCLEDLDSSRPADIVFAIDTSGSIGDRELAVVFSELVGMMQQFSAGVKGHIIFADAEVAAVYDFENVDDILKAKPAGGGGTSFIPAIKYAMDKKEKNEWDVVGLVYLTDLYGNSSDNEVNKDTVPFNVLWVSTTKEDNLPKGYIPDYGTITYLEI